MRNDRVPVVVPMVCGGVYQHTDYRGHVQSGLMLAVQQDEFGRKSGSLQIFGHAPAALEEDSVDFQRMELIGRPSSPRVGRPRKE
jgi:hypothetical protein